MTPVFAVIPDNASDAAAVFEDLETAMEWGLKRYGSDKFRIRCMEIEQAQRVSTIAS